METNVLVTLPSAMWLTMKSELQDGTDRLSISDVERRRKFGVVVSLRLHDGSVKERIEVDWDGCVRSEWYEEWGIRAEKCGPPRFAAENIESWGYYEWVRQPGWRHPFKKVKVWKVRVWADGRLGDTRP